MEDKNFLKYFEELANPDDAIKKQSAQKIVETLNVSDALSKDDHINKYSKLDEKVQKMLERYMKGDLREVSPNLNYTIKKLISGITEQIESFVKGYFLALILIVQRFKDKINFNKLINYRGNIILKQV